MFIIVIGMVGTLAKIKSQKLFDDGRVYALIEGTERFYIEEIISERPYIKARIRTFKDYTESPILLNKLERNVYDEISCNFKYLELLYPEQSYNLSSNILKYQPMPVNNDMRTIKLFDESVVSVYTSVYIYSIYIIMCIVCIICVVCIYTLSLNMYLCIYIYIYIYIYI